MLGVTSRVPLPAESKSCAGSCSFLCAHEDNCGLKGNLGSPHARYSFLRGLMEPSRPEQGAGNSLCSGTRGAQELRATTAEMHRLANHHQPLLNVLME